MAYCYIRRTLKSSTCSKIGGSSYVAVVLLLSLSLIVELSCIFFSFVLCKEIIQVNLL